MDVICVSLIFFSSRRWNTRWNCDWSSDVCSSDLALGSPGWLLIAWILTGFITIAAALSYGELAAMMPHAGGMYVYLREAYGKLPAFLYGWTLFTVIQSGTIAPVAIAFSKFTGVLF